MKQALRLGLAATAFVSLNAAADFSATPSGTYALDDTHGYVLFSYSHFGFSNPNVGFNRFDTTLDLDSDNPENSTISVTIDAASIDSRVEEFNGHLNGENYFDTANHPEITFTSTSVSATGDNTFDVTGDLTIKGTTKPVTLAATINKAAKHPFKGMPTVGVSATGTLLRSEWGLGNYAPAVGDEVTLHIEVELNKAE
ncbi:MAG: YceI family protein [Woeseiaceae bacterium]|nr:YceI family protein [Woeseiaceae bacterium]